MALWEDFTDKAGFSDGGSVGEIDFRARRRLVQLINEHPASKAAKITAVEFDRPGMHNVCLICILPNPKGLKPKTLLSRWDAGELQEAELPDEINEESGVIHDLIAQAYDEVCPFKKLREVLTLLKNLKGRVRGPAGNVLLTEIASLEEYLSEVL